MGSFVVVARRASDIATANLLQDFHENQNPRQYPAGLPRSLGPLLLEECVRYGVGGQSLGAVALG